MAAVEIKDIPFSDKQDPRSMLLNLRTTWENFRKIRNHFPYFNVLDYGAKGDGVTDDTAAIQRCLDAAISATQNDTFVQFYSAAINATPIGARIIFPPGTYVISSTLNAQGIYNLEGSGPNETILKAAASFSGTSILQCKILSGSKLWILGGQLRGIKFLGTSSVGCVSTYRNHLWRFYDCVFADSLLGLDGQGAYSGSMYNCEFQNNTKAIKYSLINDSPIFEESNAISHYGCEFFGNTTTLDLGGSQNMNFHGGVIQGSQNAVVTNGTCSCLNFNGVYWESNGDSTHYAITGDILNLIINDGFINQNSGRFIDATSLVQIYVARNEIRGGKALIYIPSGSSIVKLEYGKNRIYFSTTWTENIIINGKTGFCPDTLYLSAIPNHGIAAATMIKDAFNGSRGRVCVDTDYANQITIDFTSDWFGESTGCKLDRGGANPVKVISGNVSLRGLYMVSTFENGLILGDGATIYSNISVRDCVFDTGGVTYPMYVFNLVQDFIFEDLRFLRSNNGASVFLDGQKGVLRNLKTGNGFTTSASLQANQANNSFFNVDGISLAVYLPYTELAAAQIDGNVDARTTMTIPGSSANSMTRPAIGTGTLTGEVHGYRSGLAASDDGFMRLSAGGGTTAAEKTGIDISGYSTLTDMRGTIVFFVHGAEVCRWSYNDGFYISAMRFMVAKGANVASANNMTLGGDGNYFLITGTNNINGIASASWRAGSLITLEFSAAATIKHNTAASAGFLSIITKTGADVVMAADSIMQLRLNAAGTKWLEV